MTRSNKRTSQFKELFFQLPAETQELADRAYQLFLKDPAHPSLRHHELKATARGRHRPGSFSVSISRRHRAIYLPDGNDNVWYWIGTHESYNNFVGLK